MCVCVCDTTMNVMIFFVMSRGVSCNTLYFNFDNSDKVTVLDVLPKLTSCVVILTTVSNCSIDSNETRLS